MNIFKHHESQVQSYANHFPVVFTTAKGNWLHSQSGEAYLDFLAGAGSLNYGHNNAVLKQALLEYIERDGLTHGLDMHSQAKAQFIQALQSYILEPRGLNYKVQFTGPTGTNAVEAALKLARKVTGRQNIVTFTNGFHGCSLGALAATGNQHHRQGAGLALSGVSRLPYEGYAGIDGLTLFETMLQDNSSGLDKPAAVLLETVQGEGGLNVASDAWLQRLQTLCRAQQILLIVDDIQAGCGRTGTFFSFEPSGIEPDMVTLSKSLSGYGLPMAIVLLKPEWDQWKPGEHNGTFRGNNHAFVTATRALEAYWANEDFQTHIAARSEQVTQALQHCLHLYPTLFSCVKGRGLMQGVACHNGEIARDIAAICFQNGLIIETAGAEDEVLKVFCPLTITEADLAHGLTIIERSAARIAPRGLQQAS